MGGRKKEVRYCRATSTPPFGTTSRSLPTKRSARSSRYASSLPRPSSPKAPMSALSIRCVPILPARYIIRSRRTTVTTNGGKRSRRSSARNSQYGVTGADAADRGLSCERPKDAQFRATSGREPVMKEKLRFLGLDVHAETIAVAVAEPEGEVRSLGTIPNRAESIRKLIKKLGPAAQAESLL